jgi:hypothetical protein
MHKYEPAPHDYRFLTVITLGFVLWLWISLLLTLSNAFFTPVLWVFLGMLGGFGVYVVAVKKQYRVSRELLIVAGVSLVLATLLACVTTPTIFSGRDQGSYSQAAIHLAQNHRLEFSTPASTVFFTLHGPGKALNFPGFDYTTDGLLTTQFPLGYIVWLASLFALFGVSGLVLANALTLALFLIAFYFLIRLFASRFYAIWGFIIAATSLPVVWFSKITLSENVALTLFTLLALHLILVLKERSRLAAFISLALAAFFVFTRIEGIAFLLITIGILAFSSSIRTLWTSKPMTYVIFPMTVFLLFVIRSLFINFPFYKTIAKAGLHKWQSFFEPCTAADCLADKSVSLWHIFFVYGLLPVFIIGSISIVIFFKGHRKLALLPFALAIPTGFYLFSPSISIDQPWMLRRFIFSLYPTMLFSSIVGIAIIQTFLTDRYKQHFLFKKPFYASILLSALFISQLPFALQYGTFSENKGLLEQTEALAAHFSSTDLVLVDRLATGDAWSMIPEPLSLFGVTNAVYFFNPEDFATLDRKAFSHTYLIVSEDEALHYIDSSIVRFTPVATYEFDTERLDPSTDAILPQKVHSLTKVAVLEVK